MPLPSFKRRADNRERGQAMVEFAVAAPLVALMVAGVILAGYAAFRAVAADWGVFVTGAAAGAYGGPVEMRHTVPWPDIREGISVGVNPLSRQAVSRISVTVDRPFMLDLRVQERVSIPHR